MERCADGVRSGRGKSRQRSQSGRAGLHRNHRQHVNRLLNLLNSKKTITFRIVLHRFFSVILRDTWIGLNDETTEGTFEWSDGTQGSQFLFVKMKHLVLLRQSLLCGLDHFKGYFLFVSLVLLRAHKIYHFRNSSSIKWYLDVNICT